MIIISVSLLSVNSAGANVTSKKHKDKRKGEKPVTSVKYGQSEKEGNNRLLLFTKTRSKNESSEEEK